MARQNKASAQEATNTEGDTPKVNRQAILLNWTTKRLEKVKDTVTGKYTANTNSKIISGNTILYYPASIIDWFNIPVYAVPQTAADSLAVREVAARVRTVYGSPTDGTGRSVNMPELELLKGRVGRNNTSRRSISVPLLGKTTGKGTQRRVHLGFPPFFNLIMIAQAVGSMLYNAQADRKPMTFKVVETGSVYTIPYNASTSVMTGATVGAWVSTSLGAELNLDNVDDIQEQTTLVSSAAQQNAPATGTG